MSNHNSEDLFLKHLHSKFTSMFECVPVDLQLLKFLEYTRSDKVL